MVLTRRKILAPASTVGVHLNDDAMLKSSSDFVNQPVRQGGSARNISQEEWELILKDIEQNNPKIAVKELVALQRAIEEGNTAIAKAEIDRLVREGKINDPLVNYDVDTREDNARMEGYSSKEDQEAAAAIQEVKAAINAVTTVLEPLVSVSVQEKKESAEISLEKATADVVDSKDAVGLNHLLKLEPATNKPELIKVLQMGLDALGFNVDNAALLKLTEEQLIELTQSMAEAYKSEHKLVQLQDKCRDIAIELNPISLDARGHRPYLSSEERILISEGFAHLAATYESQFTLQREEEVRAGTSLNLNDPTLEPQANQEENQKIAGDAARAAVVSSLPVAEADQAGLDVGRAADNAANDAAAVIATPTPSPQPRNQGKGLLAGEDPTALAVSKQPVSTSIPGGTFTSAEEAATRIKEALAERFADANPVEP